MVEKFVERAKAVRESTPAVRESTPGYRPYRTAKTAVRCQETYTLFGLKKHLLISGFERPPPPVVGELNLRKLLRI